MHPAVFAQSGGASATVRDGKGSIVWASGGYYVGEIKNGQMHGEGTLTFEVGAKYTGQWKDDKMHGFGKCTEPDGQVVHDGEWENGQPKE